MTEARASLAHDEAGAVAVAVEVDADQLLGGTAGLALDPQAAGAGLVDTHPAADGLADRFAAGVDEAQRYPALVDHDGGPEPVGAVGDERGHDGVGEVEPAGVEGHADLGIGAQLVEGADFVGGGDTAGDGDAAGLAAASTTALASSRSVPPMRPSRSTKVTRKPATCSFSSAMRSRIPRPVPSFQPSTTTSPCLASRAATTRSRGELGEDLGLGHGAEDDLGGTEVEPADRGLDIADAAADAALGSGPPAARPGRRCCPCAWRRRGR